MKEVIYQKNCGCCTGVAHFSSLEHAAEVFKSLLLSVGASFTDDEGILHDDVDTFYGFSAELAAFDQPLVVLGEKLVEQM